MFLSNDDINQNINKFVNIKTILILRQAYKKNNNFKILKEFNYIRKLKYYDLKNLFYVNNNDIYKIELIIYEKLFLNLTKDCSNYQKLIKYINTYNKEKILDKISNLTIIEQKNIIRKYNSNINYFIGFLLENNILYNLKNIKCSIYLQLLFTYLEKKKISLNIDKLSLDISNIKNKQVNLYVMYINNILKYINTKYVIFYNYNLYFKENIIEYCDFDSPKLLFN